MGSDAGAKPWQDPTRWEGVTCPHCAAPPGSLCRGRGVVRGCHARRRDRARANAMEAGAFGRTGQVTCPSCGAFPGQDCRSPSGRSRLAGDQPLFHDARIEEARGTQRRLTRPPGEGGRRLVEDVVSNPGATAPAKEE